MKKIVSFIIVLSLCVIPFKNNTLPMVETEALNIPLKTCYSDFSNKEQLQIKSLSSISNNEPTEKANYINNIKDSNLYEYCLKETLDVYYSDLETYLQQLNAFKKRISSAAYDIINNYEVAAEERAAGIENGYSPTEVLVNFAPGTSSDTIKIIGENLGKGYEVIFDGFFNPADDIPEIRKKYFEENKDYGAIVSIDVDLDKTTTQTMSEVNDIACVENCARNDIIESDALASDFSQEPRVNEQYYLNTINIGDAWQAIADSRVFQETIVAVLDSGLDVDHEDVVGNFSSKYSVDITKSGYPKLSEANTPYSSNHGTAVWGVIRARPKNKKGITGMHLPVQDGYSGVIKVMAVKMTSDSSDSATTQNHIDAIEYAVEKGASIINISRSFSTYNGPLHEVIKDAYDMSVTIIASAGNTSSTGYRYPASHDEVIGVAATDSNNQMCDFTTNNDKTDICAPGKSILVLDVDNKYKVVNGTSFSAPIIAGTVALMQSFYIHDTLSPSKVKDILIDNAVDLSSVNVWDNDLVNTGKSVEYTRYLAMKDDTLKIRSVVLSNSNKSKLRWYPLDYSSCDGYKIYRATSANGTYSAVGTVNYEDALWDGTYGCHYWYDNSSQSGKTYYYKVRAFVKYGTGKKYSNYTGIKSITIP